MSFEEVAEEFDERLSKFAHELKSYIEDFGFTAEIERKFCGVNKEMGEYECETWVRIYNGKEEIGNLWIPCQLSKRGGSCIYSIDINGVPRNIEGIEDKLPEKLRGKCRLESVHVHGNEAHVHVVCKDIEPKDVENTVIDLALWNKRYAV